MAQNQRSKLDTEYLYSKIKYRHLLSEKSLEKTHPRAFEFFNQKGLPPGKIREHAQKILASGVLAGSLLLSTPNLAKMPAVNPTLVSSISTSSTQSTLVNSLASILPKGIKLLTSDQETEISHLLYETFGISAVPKLGATKLNHVYGLIGAEQHLPRFPGDNVAQHQEFLNSGITPGLGAWGYFAPSKQKLTDDLINKEKYYVAVQTLYLPDWLTNFRYLRDWYKYRKVVVVNPVNGKTIICDVADSGPANWTGKHFGGSPEVMAYLGLNVGKQKGPVVLYFVDDPDGNVPLGPLEYNIESNTNLLAKK